MSTKSKPTKQILRGVTVAVAGHLGEGWTDADVTRWLTYHGGRFSAIVTDEVTHVLCTEEEYAKRKKDQCSVLQHALQRGHKEVHIVLRDWLEDSLHKGSRRREKPYLLRHIHWAAQQLPAAVQKRLAERCAKGRQQAEYFVDESLYRIYRDQTGFQYKAVISRDCASAGIFGERYVLYLFESIAKPHLYWFAARHYKSKTHTQAQHFRPSETCQLFQTEFAHFCAFFLRKTGVPWDARLVSETPEKEKKNMAQVVVAVTGTEAEIPNGAVGSEVVEMPGYFIYRKPARGMPIGAIEDERNVPIPEEEKWDAEKK